MSGDMRMFMFNLVLCLASCGLAALLGRLTRKTGGFRLLVGLLVAPMLSWVTLETGGGRFGDGIFPTVLLLFIMILEPIPDNWQIFNNDGGIGDDFFFFSSVDLLLYPDIRIFLRLHTQRKA